MLTLEFATFVLLFTLLFEAPAINFGPVFSNVGELEQAAGHTGVGTASNVDFSDRHCPFSSLWHCEQC
jgi:hypothetical protein